MHKTSHGADTVYARWIRRCIRCVQLFTQLNASMKTARIGVYIHGLMRMVFRADEHIFSQSISSLTTVVELMLYPVSTAPINKTTR